MITPIRSAAIALALADPRRLRQLRGQGAREPHHAHPHRDGTRGYDCERKRAERRSRSASSKRPPSSTSPACRCRSPTARSPTSRTRSGTRNPRGCSSRLIAETIRARGDRLVVDGDDPGAQAAMRISGTLREFGYDARTWRGRAGARRRQARRRQQHGDESAFEARVPGVSRSNPLLSARRSTRPRTGLQARSRPGWGNRLLKPSFCLAGASIGPARRR